VPEIGTDSVVRFWRKFRKRPVALVASAFVLALVVLAVIGAVDHPDAETSSTTTGSTRVVAALFGVDSLGRDIFSRILMGARISLASGIVSVALGALVGTSLGLMAGYYEGWWDRITMRICDVLFAFPGILLAIGVVAILGNGIGNVIVAVSIFSIPTLRAWCAATRSRSSTHVRRGRAQHRRRDATIVAHIFPGTISAVVVYFSLRIGTSIITAASLSFLGMGAQPPTPEWGAMLDAARSDMMTAPHVALFPALAIFATVLAFNLLGDGCAMRRPEDRAATVTGFAGHAVMCLPTSHPITTSPRSLPARNDRSLPTRAG
jgi:glutathione transport system permease protein